MRHATGLAPLAALSLVLAAAAANASEKPKPAREGLLAELPSSPGTHVAKIEALGDGAWLDLGAPAPDPKWGGAPGRAYTNKMAYAPDLVGAFLLGEGVHGARGEGPRKGYYNDDVFFYDLMAHRYICLFPGTTEAQAKQVKVDANGFTASKEDGQNFPHAIAVHGYECLSYNPETREFMALLTGSPYSRTVMADFPKEMRERESGKHPYFFGADTGRWVRRKVNGDGPGTHFCKALEYIPSLKQTMFYGRSDSFWFYDHKTNAWTVKKAEGGAPAAWSTKGASEGTCCYDSKRDRLYIFNRAQNSIPCAYDFKTNKMIDLEAKNQPYPGEDHAKGVRSLASTSSGVHYDSAADVVVMRLTVKQGTGDMRNIPSKRIGLAIYDPNTNAWAKEFVPLPEFIEGGCWNSCYSPELNVHAYHIAGDSRANGKVVVYRHKRAEK